MSTAQTTPKVLSAFKLIRGERRVLCNGTVSVGVSDGGALGFFCVGAQASNSDDATAFPRSNTVCHCSLCCRTRLIVFANYLSLGQSVTG